MTRFFKLTTDMAEFLRDNLTHAQWKLWSLFATLDPFGKDYIELPPLITILMKCKISERTFYRAIAKFKKLELFDFQYDRAYIRNLNGSDKNGSPTVMGDSENVMGDSENVMGDGTSIYKEFKTNQTLLESSAHEEKKESEGNSNSLDLETKQALSTIPKTENDSLVKSEIICEEYFSAARTTKTVQQRNFNWLPDGPWNLEGKLDPNFRDAIANDWLKRFGGDIHSKRADVLSHFKKDPANLPIRWEQYQSEYLNRFESTQILLSNGVEIPQEYQDKLIANQRAVTAQLPQELNAVLQQPQLSASNTVDLSLSNFSALPQSIKNEEGQTFKLFRASDNEVTPEQAEANRKFLSNAIAEVFGNKIKKETPKTLPFLEQLNIWINDPILQKEALKKVITSDRYECLFDDDGIPYQVIEIQVQVQEEYDF